MKNKYKFSVACVTLIIMSLYATVIEAQNVGVNSTGAAPDAGAMLDISSTNKGILIPRVNISNLATIAPVTGSSTESMLVYNTNATTGKGYHYWDGNDWIPLGNDKDWKITGNGNITNGTHFLGTTNNRQLDFRTSNTLRLRIKSNGQQIQAGGNGTALAPFYTWQSDPNTGLYRGGVDNLRISTAGADRMAFLANGETVVGALTTVIPDDLFSGVSNVTLDWAVNGYSGFDGGGVYGQITGGSTVFAAIQGEYVGTNRVGPGIRGSTYTTTAGSDFDGNTVSGVTGSLATGNLARSFGVYGDVGDNFSRRTGGVLGSDFFARGALGYYAQNNSDYAVYGFGGAYTTGGATGKMSNPLGDFNNMIGLGIYGGVMGGWIKGLAYGAHFSGERYGAYVDGKSLTNEVYVVLTDNESGLRTPSYASTSLSVDVNAKGVANLVNGEAEVLFDKEYRGLISSEKPIIVTVTPMGETKGVHIVSVNKNGFKIKENGNGTSNVAFSWISIAEKKGYETVEVSNEILSQEFDKNMSGVMHNDGADYDSNPLWWNGSDVTFDKNIPIDKIEAAKLKIHKSSPDTRRHKPEGKKKH